MVSRIGTSAKTLKHGKSLFITYELFGYQHNIYMLINLKIQYFISKPVTYKINTHYYKLTYNLLFITKILLMNDCFKDFENYSKMQVPIK